MSNAISPYLELSFGPNDTPLLRLSNPITVIEAWVKDSTLVDADQQTVVLETTLCQLEQRAKHEQLILAGYLGYEANHAHYGLSANKHSACQLPDVWLGLFEAPDDTHTAPPFGSLQPTVVSQAFQAHQNYSDYEHALKQINHYIHSGDCYQINFTQLFTGRGHHQNYAAYKALSQVFNAPYGGYFHSQHGEILCFSPEQFIHVDAQQRIQTKPIKGTTARLDHPQADTNAAQALQRSDKNRAENLMIVDLLRNDLNRVCQPASVTVDKLFDIESYTNVHHLVSTISGQLRAETSACEALLSSFPGGSITGAPKKRAMEIIDELEPIKRHAYCGSLFYKLPNGELNSNIMIRTVINDSGNLHCWAGGGIVADSTCKDEYQECLDKVGAIIRHFEGK